MHTYTRIHTAFTSTYLCTYTNTNTSTTTAAAGPTSTPAYPTRMQELSTLYAPPARPDQSAPAQDTLQQDSARASSTSPALEQEPQAAASCASPVASLATKDAPAGKGQVTSEDQGGLVAGAAQGGRKNPPGSSPPEASAHVSSEAAAAAKGRSASPRACNPAGALRALLGDVSTDEDADAGDSSAWEGTPAGACGGVTMEGAASGPAAVGHGNSAADAAAAGAAPGSAAALGGHKSGDGAVGGRAAAAAVWSWQAYEAYVRARADQMWEELPAGGCEEGLPAAWV